MEAVAVQCNAAPHREADCRDDEEHELKGRHRNLTCLQSNRDLKYRRGNLAGNSDPVHLLDRKSVV